MKLKEIKANKVFMIITLLIVGFYTYSSFAGRPFWQSSGVQRNAGYSGPIPHSGYGARFYHK